MRNEVDNQRGPFHRGRSSFSVKKITYINCGMMASQARVNFARAVNEYPEFLSRDRSNP